MKVEENASARRFLYEARRILRAYLDRKGIVIYSNKSTLRPGAVLFYGFNPGYDPEEQHRIFWSIGKSLDQFASDFEELKSGIDAEGERVPSAQRLHRDWNLIDDQRWPDRNLRTDYLAGRAPYQEHTRNLLKVVGCNDAVVTNLLFLQAPRPTHIAEQLNGEQEDFKAVCLKVHDLIFEISKPPVLITCAAVLDCSFQKWLSLKLVSPPQDSGYGPRNRKWLCKQWQGNWQEHPITVCQIPHMSYYDISHRPEVVEWAKGVVESAMRSSGFPNNRQAIP